MKIPSWQSREGIACATAIPCWQLSRILLAAFIFFLALQPAAAQDTTGIIIRGLVKDSAGIGLSQVTVSEKGTKNATITASDGSFSLRLRNRSNAIEFSSVGFVTQTLAVGDKTEFNITLERDRRDLGEVVVIGYGAKKKESLTGAISSITSKDLERVHGGSTVSTGLAGKIPGVSFRMPDGRPGSSANIQIRNMGSPLYVIDGIQQDAGQFNNLSPSDIESITVLKDASAAVYGVRAANGVVVVTTKKGKLGARNTFNVDAYAGIQNWTSFPEVLTNSYDYMRYRAEAEINRYGNTNITDEELEKYKAGTERGYQSFDWKNFILKKNAPVYSINVNASGGSDKIQYYISGTRLFQNSVLGREFTFERNNIQSNVTAKISNRLKLGVQVNGRTETRDNPGVPYVDDYWLARFAILRNTPLERPYANDNPEFLNDIKHNETNWAYLNKKNAGKYKSDWRVLQSNFTAEYQIPGIKGLQLSGIFSYYYADHLLNNHEYTYKTYTYDPNNDTYSPTGGSTNPWREREQLKHVNYNTQLQLSYNNTFGLHNISATVVAERIKNQRIRNWIHSVPNSNVLPLIYFNTADTYQDSDDREARIGYIGRVSYGYDNRYYIDLAGRRDASYLFAPDNRVGYFPSVSAAWRITAEKFAQNILGDQNILTDLKLRASYGVLGDDKLANGDPIVPPFAYMEGYNYNQPVAILDGIATLGTRDKGVPINNITWVRSAITNIGLDFSLLNGKLTGAVEYFYRKRTKLRGRKLDVLVPLEIGYALPDESINSDAQYGQEASLNYTGAIGNVNFSVGGNFMYTRSKFLSSYNPVFFHSWDQYRNSVENRFLRIDWGLETLGQFQSQEEINNHPVNIDGKANTTLLPGDLIYKDQNGDGKIDGYDTRPIGFGRGTQPNITFGFNFGLSYKGFDFHADFSGAAGYTWYQSWETRWAFQNDGNLNTIFQDRWHRENMRDPNSKWIPGKYPANRFNDGGHSNYYDSDFWAHNVKYLRARTIELGYTVPGHLISRFRMQRARIYVNTYNLFTISNLNQFNIDPEITEENGLQFPQNRIVNFGINLSF
jgi:TonB-linked SusC/RagA family outer membrane protein